MKVGLLRADSRLIHGQVITKWLNYSKANVIIVVNNELSKDSFMADIYSASAPAGIDVFILSVDDFMKSIENNNFEGKTLLILTKDVETIYELYKKGFKVEHIQLGGLPSGRGKKQIYKAVYLDDSEVKMLKEICDSDVYIDMQVIPEDTKEKFSNLI